MPRGRGLVGALLIVNCALSAMVIDANFSKEDRVRTESRVLEEDFLFLGKELNFSGQAEDLIFLGERLSFSGRTTLGLIALGERIVFTGEASNGIITAANTVTISGRIRSNSFAACRRFELANNGSIEGNLFVACATLMVEGTMRGDLYAASSEVVINNEVHGNVNVRADRLTIGENGRIHGNLIYGTRVRPSQETLSRVSGTITVREGPDRDRFPTRAMGVLIGVGLFISFVAVGLLLLLFPAFRGIERKQTDGAFWRTALWGLVPLFMYPAAVALLFVLVITIPFAFVLLLATIPLLYLAGLIGVTLTGNYIVNKLRWNVEKRHYQFLIGALVSSVLSFIPYVNVLAFIFFAALGWGVILSFLFRRDLSVA